MGIALASALRSGLVGGAVVIYLGLVGMLGKFAERNLIGTQLSIGRLMLMIPPVVAAWVAVRPRVQRGELREVGGVGALAAGAVVGAVGGGVVAAAVIFADRFGVDRVRAVFIQAAQAVLDFLTFGRSMPAGLLLLVVGATALGLVGGGFRALPRPVRRPIVIALVVVILVAALQRVIEIALIELGVETGWLYSRVTRSLTWGAALGIFVVVAAAVGLLQGRASSARARVRATVAEAPGAKAIAILALAGVLVVVPQLVGSVISEVLGTVAVFLLLGIGLNIVVGYAGLLDLGYVAFFGFGAYAIALLTGAAVNETTGPVAPAISLDLNFYLALPVLLALAAIVGLMIGAPVLRLRGDYLAIVTLGLGEIVSVLLLSNWLRPLVGGPQGMRGVTDAAIGGIGFRQPQHFYYLALAFVGLALLVSSRLASSRVGRAWQAMREDEQVADAMGISTIRYKLLAFAMGGAIGSLGGALIAVKIGSLSPASFQILVSITALAVVILGGMGSLPGVLVGGLVLIGLPSLLREFEEFRLLIYGAVLVAIMIFRPQGLVPNVRRMGELKEEERAQDAWAKQLAEQERAMAAVPGGSLGAEEPAEEEL